MLPQLVRDALDEPRPQRRGFHSELENRVERERDSNDSSLLPPDDQDSIATLSPAEGA